MSQKSKPDTQTPKQEPQGTSPSTTQKPKPKPAPKSAPKRKPKPRRPRGYGGKLAAQIVASLVLVGVAGYGCFSIYRSLSPVVQESDGLNFMASAPESTEPTEPATEAKVYENVSVDNAEAKAGDLILVNSSYGYTDAHTEELSNIYEYKTAHELDSYHISGSEISLREDALVALSDLLDAFCTATGHDDVIILDGYRTRETQQSLYDADLEATGLDYSERVALPGHSEHECGYAVDLSLYQDGYINDYDGSGDYSWINENCKQYGYILRYAADKTDQTGIQAEPWHYRYVGQPHATYIMDNGLCLEEYILLLTGYNSDNPLRITNWDDKVYEVYYVPADTGADSTFVMVPPDQDYTISGNNAGGFIVTVDTGEIQPYTPPTSTTDDSTAEDSSAADDTTDADDAGTDSVAEDDADSNADADADADADTEPDA